MMGKVCSSPFPCKFMHHGNADTTEKPGWKYFVLLLPYMQVRVECRICESLQIEYYEIPLYKTPPSHPLNSPPTKVPVSVPNGRGLIRNLCFTNLDNWLSDKFCLSKTGSFWIQNHTSYVVPSLPGVLDLSSADWEPNPISSRGKIYFQPDQIFLISSSQWVGKLEEVSVHSPAQLLSSAFEYLLLLCVKLKFNPWVWSCSPFWSIAVINMFFLRMFLY